jgi:hypothetical protein
MQAMAAVTFAIEPDELRGLTALAALDAANGAAGGVATQADAVGVARTLLDAALADRLTRAGLPWAPATEIVRQCAAPDTEAVESTLESSARPAMAGAPATAAPTRARRTRIRQDIAYALAIAVAVVLWGGYARGWAWTGFRANGQLWDWLNLLLLPVVIGGIPLWIQYKRYIGRTRRAIYAAVIAAWTGFVIAGYAVPIGWTGFRGQTLWNWFGLLLLPATLAITAALAGLHVRPAQVLRSLHSGQLAVIAALAAGWIVTVIGGYALRWSWTGYTGNTLWDWLKLLLLPLVVPTVLLPALLNWITGDAAGRAAARQPAVKEEGKDE